MKIAWMTDVHLDHLVKWEKNEFFKSLADIECDAFLVTGDIATGKEIVDDLVAIGTSVAKPVYFVLGNHDYWFSSAAKVRHAVKEVEMATVHGIIHLNNVGFVALSKDAALVGHDCWYDGQYGDWKTSTFRMNDWAFMEDYKDLEAAHWNKDGYIDRCDTSVVIGKSRALAAEGVRHIEQSVESAVGVGFKHIVVASHVPPFDEAHVFMGKKGDDNAQPWFTCKMLGDLLMDLAKKYPDVKFTSLSGHTHGKTVYTPIKNVVAHVGGARYERPELQCIFEF